MWRLRNSAAVWPGLPLCKCMCSCALLPGCWAGGSLLLCLRGRAFDSNCLDVCRARSSRHQSLGSDSGGSSEQRLRPLRAQRPQGGVPRHRRHQRRQPGFLSCHARHHISGAACFYSPKPARLVAALVRSALRTPHPAGRADHTPLCLLRWLGGPPAFPSMCSSCALLLPGCRACGVSGPAEGAEVLSFMPQSPFMPMTLVVSICPSRLAVWRHAMRPPQRNATFSHHTFSYPALSATTHTHMERTWART